MRSNILERWKITPAELAEIIQTNPSMRGMLFGYVAEYKLRQIWFSDERVENTRKYDDHDKSRPSDLSVTYKGVEVTVEVKSLQTSSTSKVRGRFFGNFQCDASDRRQIQLPNGDTLQTTCLLIGQFDLLAVCLFAFQEEWQFGFVRNAELQRSTFARYTPEQRQYLLKTQQTITWPLQSPFEPEPFGLMDEIVRDKSR